MKRIALLVTHDYYPGRPDRDEPDYAAFQLRVLAKALLPLDLAIEPVFWQDEGIEWSRYCVAMPLLAWNYPQQVGLFLSRLGEIEAAGVTLLNSRETIIANMDKSYLARLASLGAPVPATIDLEAVTEAAIEASFEALGCDEIIIKPRIGAGAWRQVRLRRGAPIPSRDLLPPGAALVQPFLLSVTEEGELSLLYFGGRFSHALIKTPKSGDYRTQGQHGAIERQIDAPKTALDAANAILDRSAGSPFTYARVDLVRGPKGEWLLMELELIEPWLYLDHDGHGGTYGSALLATAIAQHT
jgi:hypothetical protein